MKCVYFYNLEADMLRFLFFSFVLLFAFDASAVRQSVSKALSYRNIGHDVRTTNNQTAEVRTALTPKKSADPVIFTPKDEKINLTTSDTDSVSLRKNDTVEIALHEESGYSWEAKTSSSNILLKSNSVDGSSRVLKYKMLSNPDKDIYIYFDYVKEADNSIEKSKQLTIRLRQ